MLILSFGLCFVLASAEVLKLTSSNRDVALAEDKVSFVNFYADWCRFSRQLAPIFEAAEKELTNEEQLVFARVDCDKDGDLCKEFMVNKYPTIKLFRHGKPLKKEYRGQRSVAAIKTFLLDQIRDPIIKVKELKEIDELTKPEKRHKSMVVGYFESEDSPEYKNFQISADELVESCVFIAAIGDIAKPEMKNGQNVLFKNKLANRVDRPFYGQISNQEIFKKWTDENCVPLVREINFNNAEEITEEGLPLMIMFHKKEDTKSLETFQQAAQRWLFSQKGKINVVTAIGEQFTHPLYHLGKSIADCPVIAIDSFSHMYVFKKSFDEIVRLPHLLTFANDLHSGKLHREFHHGPDPEAEEKAQEALEEVKKIEEKAEKVQDEIEEVQEKLEEVAEKIDETMDETDKHEDELEEVDNPRQKAAKDKILEQAAAKEDELLKHEDALYDELEKKEDELAELEEKKQEHLEKAQEHLEKAKSGGTPPIESQFKKLAPSETKYTLKRKDEL